MTNRIPLIVNVGTGQIQELPASDSLDLGLSNLVNGGNVSAAYFIGDGSQLTNIPGSQGEASFTLESSNFSATAGTRYAVNTAGAPVTCTLPASPANGAAVFFADAGGAYATNNFIVDPGVNTIMGSSGTLVVNTNDQSFGLLWNGATWRLYT